MPEADYCKANRWLPVIVVTPEKLESDGEQIFPELEKENIEFPPVWKPMHMQPVFTAAIKSLKLKAESVDKYEKQYPARVVRGEVAEDFFNIGLCLPSGIAMNKGNLDRICGIIRKCHQK